MTHSLFNLKLNLNNSSKLSTAIISFIITAGISASSFAGEEITSNSYSASKNKITVEVRNNNLEQSKLPAIADQLTGKATGKQRSVMNDKTISTSSFTNQVEQTIQTSQDNIIITDILPEYFIYSATASLIDDVDFDGYFRSFSITFDADVLSYYEDIHLISEVYAELYLRKNGGPWIHYYTTDNFIIDGDTTEDEHEVITTLGTGYVSGEYDVLIDLYEVGFEDVVATISADDINELYALPLESANNDIIYVDHHGGSFSFFGLMVIFLVTLKRFIKPNQYSK